MSNLFKPYEKTTGWITANPPPDQEEETQKPKSTSAKSEDKSSTKATKQESKPKAASNEPKPKSTTDTQPKKSNPFLTAAEQDGFMHPQSGFSLDPKKELEPKAPEKKKGLMAEPQQPQKTILGMKYDPPKPAEPPEEAGERHWFLEGLLGEDYTTKFNKQPTPDDPFLKGLYGVEEPKHHTDEASTPQQFVSKTRPIDKFMGVTPSAPFDRPLDNPQNNQPQLPPKPESGAPKDYVHNPEGKKTYDFRNPRLSALDYVFGTDFKPIEWKQGIDSGGKLGYDGNKDAGKANTNGYINEPENWENELHNSIKARVDTLPSNLSDEDRVQWIDSIILDEAEKLQKKYSTIYNSSNNILTSIFSPGLHNKLKPLFTEYHTKETQTDPLFEAATNGLSAGFNAGLWTEALKGITPEGVWKYADDVVEDVVKTNSNNVKVNIGQQDKHIPGTNNYKQSVVNGKSRSVLNENPQQLLDDFAGTGQKIPRTNRERVDFGRVIGQYYDDATGTYVDTTKGIIHYDNKGGAHIVPARP